MVADHKTPLLHNVQALRGIAALMVCAFHYRFAVQEHGIQDLFRNGWIGVQVFFMISGFIMVHTTRNLHGSPLHNAAGFIKRRLIRIVPLYYFATFLFIADDINDGYLITKGKLLLTSLLFLSPLSAPIGPDYGPPCIEVGWTLNYEMLFYVLFGISILFATYRYRFLYVVFVFLIAVVPVALGHYLTPEYKVFRDYRFGYLNILTNPMLVHFLAGVTLGLVAPHIKVAAKVARWMLVITMVTFLLYYVGLFRLPFNAVTDLLFCGALVTAAVINDYRGEGIRFYPFFTSMGNYSYSLYLLHPIAVAYLQLLFVKIGLGAVLHHTFFFPVAIAFALVSAWVSYQLIEKRFTIFLRSRVLS